VHLPGRARPPRGRGNGVLLGALAALSVTGGLPWLALALPIWTYAAVLAARRYVALATVGGLAVLAVSALVAGLTGGGALAPVLAVVLVAVAGGWRQKAALARVRDGTEPRLGDPPAVRGLEPDTLLCAFLLHPMTVDDLWQPPSQRWLRHLAARGLLPERTLRRIMLRMRP